MQIHVEPMVYVFCCRRFRLASRTVGLGWTVASEVLFTNHCIDKPLCATKVESRVHALAEPTWRQLQS